MNPGRTIRPRSPRRDWMMLPATPPAELLGHTEELPSRRVFFRRRFTIPREWQRGETELWLKSFFGTNRRRHGAGVAGPAKPSGGGSDGVVRKLTFAPGTTHCWLSKCVGRGTWSRAWQHVLAFLPAPASRNRSCRQLDSVTRPVTR